MKKTFQEKLLSRGAGIVKKHKYLRIPVLGMMSAVLGIYYVCMHFANNGKRYAGLGVAAIFFVVNSSFNFHSAEEHQVLPQIQEESQVQLAGSPQVDKEATELLEDEDVLLDGYDDVELAGIENLDTYTLEDILEGNSSYLDTSEDSALQPAEEAVFSRDDWRIMLVNKQHPIPEDYTFPLGTIKGDLRCDERIMEDLLAMMQAAKDAKIDLVICSPYRDYNRQTILFNRKINNYMKKGLSYMDAYKISSQAVTAPNASEHQLGLAIDFYSSTYTKLNAGFSETQTGQWLAEHAWEYGFILRYPLGKEYITGIEFEPWHFRYVGKEAAAVITKNKITLEEFWEDYIE